MIIRSIRALIKVLFVFRGYEPQQVTLLSAARWLKQFPARARLRAFSLLDSIIYLSKRQTREYLVELNSKLVKRLRSEGIKYDSIIYVAMDDAGSSSHQMLGMLRDAANLQRVGANLVTSTHARRLMDLTSGLSKGAVVYVDDFAGSGQQFERNHKYASQWILGSLPEFLLVPVICQEAYERVTERGVEPLMAVMHSQMERPLHPLSDELPPHFKSSLHAIFEQTLGCKGLGFRDLATMVVFYRNAPNSVPLVFRGTIGQKIFRGIFPRHDDLPAPYL